MWPQPELFCCALQLVAFMLLALHLFGGSSDASAILLPFPSVGTLLPVRFKIEKGDFDLLQVPEVVCSVC